MYRHVTEPPPTKERTKMGKLLAALERLASALGAAINGFSRTGRA